MGVKLVSIEELFQQSDVVSVHTFLNKDTRGLVSARLLGMMKPDAYIVNTARGPIIDEKALIEVLQAGKIAGRRPRRDGGRAAAGRQPAQLARERDPGAAPRQLLGRGRPPAQLRVAKIILDVANGKLPERKIVINKALYDSSWPQPELRQRRQGVATRAWAVGAGERWGILRAGGNVALPDRAERLDGECIARTSRFLHS